MSSIEVASLVFGAFPVLLQCLDYYRKGLEPLEKWWQFRTRFITFIDDVRYQMMRYNESMIRLLYRIIINTADLTTMVHDPADPRWTDINLDKVLEEGLCRELDRFLRIINRMNGLTVDLTRVLQIED